MTFTRQCDGAKQPCPHPYDCHPDCLFNTLLSTRTGRDMPIEMQDDWSDLFAGFTPYFMPLIVMLCVALSGLYFAVYWGWI